MNQIKNRQIAPVIDREVDIISDIEYAMQNDDECRFKQSANLAHLYSNMDEAGRRSIDSALICICGWSLETILKNALGLDRVNLASGVPE